MKRFILYMTVALLPTLPTRAVDKARDHCRIVKMIHSTGIEYDLTYDSIGRLKTITMQPGNIISHIIYSDTIVKIEVFADGILNTRNVYTLNAKGYPVCSREENLYAGLIWDSKYYYKGAELQSTSRTWYNIATPEKRGREKEVYTWSNGNPVEVRFYRDSGKPDGKTAFRYDKNRKASQGDYWSNQYLATGIALIRPENVVTTISGAEDSYISYQYDTAGNIISMTEAETWDTSQYHYEWQCN